ncbi:efflux RND transporter periplasmic adaptor subunit [Massilia aurea]|jgi:multidrug efflux system membrane fusion protein|uniref:efflux RND transporter periplasmic adaptor subunit n=1 Tax=Massilia aurea TaxID=373040 RepID=UPI002162F25E|nr:efflux RND transporter periplasmic adaptor subunit [Massilia aurea]MCS0707294.1 efflux RND transporter periplasmic adaptor subunit [Massilia aurea]
MNNQSGMGKLRVIIAALAIAGLAGAGITGCADATSDDAPAAAAPSAPPVTSAVVIQRAVTETQEFSGRLEAIEVVAIRPRVSGYITAVNFKPGAEVKKGEVLFVIDPRPYQAEADRTKAVAAAAQARADLARLELQRAERLLADKAIAQREFDERSAGQKELDASVRAAQAEHETARLNLAYTRVTSPIDGRVSKAEITLGNLVDATAVLTSVVSLERIYASFDGDESTYLRVSRRTNAGQPVDVKVGLAGEEGFPHSGKLEFVDNQLDSRSGSVRMRATLANTDRALAPGLFARVQIAGGAPTPQILIVDRAINTDQDRKFVYVVDKDGKAEYRSVKLGPLDDGLRIVREGLKPGEKIVVNGLQRVRPGAPIAAQVVPMVATAAPATPAAATGA